MESAHSVSTSDVNRDSSLVDKGRLRCGDFVSGSRVRFFSGTDRGVAILCRVVDTISSQVMAWTEQEQGVGGGCLKEEQACILCTFGSRRESVSALPSLAFILIQASILCIKVSIKRGVSIQIQCALLCTEENRSAVSLAECAIYVLMAARQNVLPGQGLQPS